MHGYTTFDSDFILLESVRHYLLEDSDLPHPFCVNAPAYSATNSTSARLLSTKSYENLPVFGSAAACGVVGKKKAKPLEEWRRYREVRRRPWGRYTAETRDPAKNDATMWLGTYKTTEDALAYDQAAFRIHSSRAILNFPLWIGSGDPQPVIITSKSRSLQPSLSVGAAPALKRRKGNVGSTAEVEAAIENVVDVLQMHHLWVNP